MFLRIHVTFIQTSIVDILEVLGVGVLLEEWGFFWRNGGVGGGGVAPKVNLIFNF